MNGITFEGERITTMSEKKKGKKESCNNVVVVAIKAASRDISKHALVWALTHVVHQPSDSITLLLLLPSHASGRRLWGFPRFSGDCANAHRRGHTGSGLEQKSDVAELCSQMMGQLRNVYEQNRVNIKVKIVPGSPCGAVAAESKRVNANWVVLDKHLRNEEKRCMEELQCNIVVMKRNQPKVVRLNLVGATEAEAQLSCVLTCALDESSGKVIYNNRESHRDSSSPEVETQFTTTTTTTTEAGTSSGSSSDPGTSPFSVTEKEEQITIKEKRNSDAATSDSDSESSIAPTSMEFQPWVADILSARLKDSAHVSSSSKALKDKFLKLDRSDMEFSRNVRDTVSLSRNAPPGPPPLCSICQHEAPLFGKPPRWFSYAELEMATGGFSKANFLAEGGFGSVHRGVLPDGQAVAVKQHKPASSQGDHEFCSEVEVLSCAQHRNVVMLIGFCVEDRRRLLVYEYICNGSLDSHLYGRKRELLEWSARQKIAVGAARGLRYLHEECRVGCIVHRDMRPNNILITHDFEPLVGDFGLARWQPDGDLGVETRVIGTFGYLAPEYAESGQITEKADVYSFGVVLVELVTGRKAVDINRPKGQQCLTEWARPLLEDFVISELIDPRLGNSFSEQEVYCMLHAASLCIRRDPHARPKMSQVLRILEGDMLLESNYLPTPSHDPGSVSGHHSGPIKREAFGVFGGNHSCDSLRAALEKERGTKAGVCRIRGR